MSSWPLTGCWLLAAFFNGRVHVMCPRTPTRARCSISGCSYARPSPARWGKRISSTAPRLRCQRRSACHMIKSMYCGRAFMACMSSSVPLSKRKHNQLKKATGGVEPRPQLALRTLLIKVGDEDRMFSRMSAVFSGDSMPQRRSVNPHYAASIQAFTAARITSERLTCSRSARAVSWASRASSIRTATISPGPSPTGRRPRFRNRSTGKPFSASSAQAWICSSVTGLPRIVSPTTHKA